MFDPSGSPSGTDEDSVGWRYSGISGSLCLAAQCCVPDVVFSAEEDFVCSSHHHLVQFGVPQAMDQTLQVRTVAHKNIN